MVHWGFGEWGGGSFVRVLRSGGCDPWGKGVFGLKGKLWCCFLGFFFFFLRGGNYGGNLGFDDLEVRGLYFQVVGF